MDKYLIKKIKDIIKITHFSKSKPHKESKMTIRIIYTPSNELKDREIIEII